MSAPIIERLCDEADLCRNDGADDIAILLDEAADTITDLLAAFEAIRNVRVSKHENIWAGSDRCKAIARDAIAKVKGGAA